jgi:hypothetical protein
MPNSALLALLKGQAPAAPAATAAASGNLPTSTATAAAVAAVTPQVTLPNAGTTQQNLLQLVTAFAARNGTTPKVNPPEATKVLSTETLAEAGGAPQPDETDKGPAIEPPTSKPAAVLAAENEKKTRRTASVVQEELDLANAQIEVLKLQLASLADPQRAIAAETLVGELRAEALICEADKAKAWARVDEIERAYIAAEAMNGQAAQVIAALQAGGAEAKAPASMSTKDLCDALAAQGFRVQLEVPAA